MAAAWARGAAIGASDADADNATTTTPSSSLAFTCQLCRARITLTGALDADPHDGQQHPHHNDPTPQRPPRMDESFVVLPTTTAAAAAAARAASRAPPQPTTSTLPPPDPRPTSPSLKGGMDAKLRALTALFEAASTSSGADHPLCLDCSARLREELERQASEAEEDARAYEDALERLGRRREGAGTTSTSGPTTPTATSAAQFEAELAALARREQKARERGAALAARLASAREALLSLELNDASTVDAASLQYWQDASATQAALDHHVSERDALLAKTERATQRLAALRATSALNDACRIWHEGPFGTIGGFRLGRTPEHPVPWDEINAAWGLAVLLLSAMARSARVTFTGARRLLPLGSRARVADGRGTHDLFGPVSRLWTAPYDRAMAAYVGCLAEFGEFARARDLAEGRDPPFEFPFAVDGAAGTVGGHSVRLALNKEARWTRALKLMLADLKVALQWAARREAGQQQARRGVGVGPGQEAPRPLAPER
jgi:beclin 1